MVDHAGNRAAEFKLLVGKLCVAAVLGTITLLATADNPWDGDELFKGPFAGIVSYGGSDLKHIYETLRGV